MLLKEKVLEIESSEKFRTWKQENSESYLAHVFMMVDETSPKMWQAGYYNPNSDKMVTFTLDDKGLDMMPEEEIFKQPGRVVRELDLSDVECSLEESDAISAKLQEEKYPKHKAVKKIMILQKLDDEKTIWNVTFFTGTTTTLNIKIDAKSKEIVSENLIDLIDKKTMDSLN
ncbi:MAG: hypothetical protein ACLFPQ_06065 [Candidatus Woesearchaeota archaeon]